MTDKPFFENKINLETSVSEQISDMQLMRLRERALNRDLTFDEIKTLEILTKVKNTEEEKRKPIEQDPKLLKQQKMKEIAANTELIVKKK